MRDPSLSVLGEIVGRIRGSISLGEQRVKVFVSDRAIVIRNEDFMHFVRVSSFFIHYKYTGSRGEDGDFLSKVNHIATLDNYIDSLAGLDPAVRAITGAHRTPAALKFHTIGIRSLCCL